MDRDLARRASLHACLAEPIRLAIVDELAHSDRSPIELARRFDLSTNLVAHHLGVLESAGLIARGNSAGDRRRRYVRLIRDPLVGLGLPLVRPAGSILFVCTHNSARSQLAAALWSDRTGRPATSAGTSPADRVHPGAVAAGRRAGVDLAGAIPRAFDPADRSTATVVTVCDRAHEELQAPDHWWHWSIPDPVIIGTSTAFDETVVDLDTRIRHLN